MVEDPEVEDLVISRQLGNAKKPTVLWASSASILDIIDLSDLKTSGLGTSRRFSGRVICLFIVVCGTVVIYGRASPTASRSHV